MWPIDDNAADAADVGCGAHMAHGTHFAFPYPSIPNNIVEWQPTSFIGGERPDVLLALKESLGNLNSEYKKTYIRHKLHTFCVAFTQTRGQSQAGDLKVKSTMIDTVELIQTLPPMVISGNFTIG